jgi:hypothetical protein
LTTFAASQLQVTTFAVNYMGRPYMQPLRQHKALAYALLGSMMTLHFCALEVVPWVNSYLQLTAMPNDHMKTAIWFLMILDFVGAFAVEKVSFWPLVAVPCCGSLLRSLVAVYGCVAAGSCASCMLASACAACRLRCLLRGFASWSCF